MWMPEYVVASVMLVALCVYLLTGGADFGGGILDLLCVGKRGEDQRRLIAETLAPIWEANHIWLILVIVLMFVCFPPVFETMSIVLNVPLTIMLVGITLRGTAFVFRAHDLDANQVQRRWNVIFAIGSIMTPFMLGVCLGTVASGNLPALPQAPLGESGILEPSQSYPFQYYFLDPWFQRFPIVIGLMTLLICAFLASLYLVSRAGDPGLKGEFRKRAFGFGILVGLTAFLALYIARTDAPLVFRQLLGEPWSLPFQVVTGVVALTVFVALWKQIDWLAQLAGMVQAICMLSGWALAQFPYMIVDTHTILASAASPAILNPVLIALAMGSVVLVPSFAWLYWVFRR